jgi:hypothetical protein
MGEIADAMLDGTLCARCGGYLGSGSGVPVYCCGEAPGGGCKQCGGAIPRRGSFSDFCRRACVKAWNREHHNREQEERAREKRQAKARAWQRGQAAKREGGR